MPLSPVQRNLLLYGAPVVIVVGIFVFVRSQSSASSSTSSGTTTATTGTSAVDNSPIGTDQLTDFENQMTQALGTVQQEVTASQNPTATSGTTTVAPPVSPVPSSTAPAATASSGAATSTGSAPNLFPVGTQVAPGETIVQAVPADGGYVDVTSKGGLYGSGLSVSGSLIQANPPLGFKYSAQVNGNTVYEYGPNGASQFNIS